MIPTEIVTHPAEPEKVERIQVVENMELMETKAFETLCIGGWYVDGEGAGYYSNGTFYYKNRPAYPSQVSKGIVHREYPFVVWYSQ